MKRHIILTIITTILFSCQFSLSAQREWSKHLEFPARNVSASRIAILADSSIVLATERVTSSRDIVVIKMNINGDTLWSRRIDEGFDEYVGDVIADQNDVYVVGSQVAQNNAFLVFKLDANGDSLDSRKVGLPVALQINDAYLSQNRIVCAGEAFVPAGRQPAVVTYDLITQGFQNSAVIANGGNGEFNGVASSSNKGIIAVGHIDNDSAIVCRFDSSLQLVSTSLATQLGGSFRGISKKQNGYLALLAADSNSTSGTSSYVCHLDTSISITNVEMHEAFGDMRANTIVNFDDKGYVIGGNLDSGQFISPFLAFFFQSGDTLTKMLNYRVRSSTPTMLSMAFDHDFVAAVGNASVQAGQPEGYSIFIKDSIPSTLCTPGIQKYWKSSRNVTLNLSSITATTASSFVFPSVANPRISPFSLSVDTSVCLLTLPSINFNPLPDTVTQCGDSVLLDATTPGIQNYSWSTGSNSHESVIKLSGTYTVTGSTQQGISYMDTIYVKLNRNPAVLVGANPDVICEGDTTQLSTTLTANTIGQWRSSSSILNPSAFNTRAFPNTSEWFVFNATDTVTGCTNSDSVQVVIQRIANPPYVLNGVARKRNGKPLNASQVYLITYKNNQEVIIDTFKTSTDGKFSFTHNDSTVYLRVEPNIRLYQGQMITYYQNAESIDSATAITYAGCENKIGVGFRTLRGQNLTPVSEVAKTSTDFRIVPNPSDGNFRIVSQTSFNGTINIRSIQGQVLYTKEATEPTIQVKLGQSPGLYFVEYIELGSKPTVVTLVIE